MKQGADVNIVYDVYFLIYKIHLFAYLVEPLKEDNGAESIPLSYAVMTKKLDIVKILIDYCADINKDFLYSYEKARVDDDEVGEKYVIHF